MPEARKPDTFIIYNITYDDEAMEHGDDLPEWMEVDFGRPLSRDTVTPHSCAGLEDGA